MQRFFPLLIVLLIGWYLGLCVKHYLNQRPLWNDEAVVLESIEHFSAPEIFSRNLLSAQVFPRSYLFLIQSVAKSFDFHVLSLRLFPFISMLAAFFVWLKIAQYEFKEPMEYLTFILSWAASVKMVYYAAELKQYSFDVLAAGLFILFLYNQRNLQQSGGKWTYLLLLTLLPSLCLFSYMSFLFLPLIFYNLFTMNKDKVLQKRFILVYTLSLVFFGTLAYRFDISVSDRVTVAGVLSDYFISFESGGEFFKTLGEGTRNLFVRWYSETPRLIRKIATFFTAFGLIYMFFSFFRYFKEEQFCLQSLKTIAFVLFSELLILGALKKYPFSMPRTSLFYCPVVFYLTIKGIVALKKFNKYLYGLVHAAYLLFLCVISYGIADYVFTGDLGAMPNLFHRL